jgi:hypothetical protein
MALSSIETLIVTDWRGWLLVRSTVLVRVVAFG